MTTSVERGGRPATAALTVLGAVWLLLLTWFLLSPQVARIPELSDDPRPAITHLVGTGVLAAITVLWLRLRWGWGALRTLMVTAVGLAGLSLGAELVQGFIPGRQMERVDLVFNLLGTAAGIALGSVLAVAARAWNGALWITNAAIAALATAVGSLIVILQPIADPEVTAFCAASPELAEGATGGFGTGAAATPILSAVLGRSTDPDAAIGPSPSLEYSTTGVNRSADGRGLQFSGGTARTDDPAGDIAASITETDSFTIEALVEPNGLDQDGPARIVSLSEGVEQTRVNAMLGIERNTVVFRLRTECDYFQHFNTLPGTLRDGPTHLAVVYDQGWMRIHIDGEKHLDQPIGNGSLDNWNTGYHLLIGNEATGDRPFLGRIDAVHVWDRALDTDTLTARAEALRTDR